MSNFDKNGVPELVYSFPLYGDGGEELSLHRMVTNNPEWACSRMTMGNHFIQKRDAEILQLREALAAKERECEGLRALHREMYEALEEVASALCDYFCDPCDKYHSERCIKLTALLAKAQSDVALAEGGEG